jgi:hypothetical protein
LPDRSPRRTDARRAIRPARGALVAALLGLVVALACATPVAPVLPAPPARGSVHGRLLVQPGTPAAPVEPMLVFLEPLDPRSPAAGPGLDGVLLASDRGLSPAALAVAVDQPVRFANQADLYHRLFSYSESNAFDLGVLRRGESKSLQFRKPGLVRIYCSLHPSERAVVFVAPSPYFATFRPPGSYEIRDVPPGRYRLHAWSEGVAAEARAVTVQPGAAVAVGIAARPPAGSP